MSMRKATPGKNRLNKASAADWPMLMTVCPLASRPTKALAKAAGAIFGALMPLLKSVSTVGGKTSTTRMRDVRNWCRSDRVKA